jgi:Zn-dependent protease with chaperone function
MNRNRAALLLVLLALSARGYAQGDDSDDDDSDGPASPELSLRFDRPGSAAVRLDLVKKPDNWDTIRNGLGCSLHCPEQRFHSPSTNVSNSQTLNRLPVAARETYLHALADYNSRQLMANCDSVLRWNGRGREGNIDLTRLANALKTAGAPQLWVYIYFPTAGHVEYSPENLNFAEQSARHFLSYRIVLDSPGHPVPIHLFYGSAQSLYRSIGIAIAFVLFPVAITLWMRRTALVLGKQDPTAAWFSYFRTINWCIKGSMLLWITSGLGARQGLQDWSSFAFSPGWATTLLDIAVMIGPAFVIYFACLSLSYPLHLHLRGTTWTRREFLLQQLINAGVQAFPLLFFVAAIESIAKNPNAAASYFLLALLSWFVLRNLQMRVSKSYPHALTTGELRDRVFALANKARVKVTQIFVLPTGKGQVANAYAAGNGVIMFTDYLLQHLSKREVEAVAAHEIAHLQLGHVKKRGLALYAALMLPALLGMCLEILFDRTRLPNMPIGVAAQLYSGMAWFWHWSQRDFVLILAALLLFYLLSRRFEFAADERAVALNGDAEAQISGLLKLSRLNLMPIQWGKATGTWLTHPSMVRRAERIAASAAMAPERLQAILDRHEIEMKSGAANAVLTPSEDHYSVPEATDPENLLSAAIKHKGHQLRLWTLLVMHVIPPAVVAAFVRAQHLQGDAALFCYLGGAIATPILCIALAAQLALLRRRAQRARLVQRFQREGLGLTEDSIAVGFSPGALVRFFGTSYYNWDIGFLVFSGNRISYIGEQVRFSLARQEIDSVCIGQGGPSWWKFPRVYIRWTRADGTPSVFSIASLEPTSVWKVRKQTTQLFQRVKDFRTSSRNDVHSTLPELPPLVLGDITSRSPRELGGLKTTIQLFIFLLPLAAVVNALLRADAIWYILGTIVVTRLIESIPHMHFRDRLLLFETESSAKAAAAK